MIHDYSRHDKNEMPHKVPRHVTDFGCCLLFVAAMAALAMVTQFALLEGNPKDYASLPIHSGEMCGVSESVKDKRYLYFCGAAMGNVSYANTICVNTCTEKACPNYVKGVTQEVDSKPFAGLICLPDFSKHDNKKLARKAFQIVAESENVKHLLQAKGIADAWPLLLVSALSSIVFGYLFLHCLETFAGCLLKLSFTVIIVLLGSFGGYMLFMSNQMDGANPLPGTGDRKYDIVIGNACIVLSAGLCCVACCLLSSMQKATHCIEAAAECIAETPALIFEPFVSLAIRATILVGLITGLVHLLACVKKVTGSDQGIDVEYSQQVYAMLGFYVFMMVWIMELCSATSTFVVSYVVQLWFLDTNRVENGKHRTRFVVLRAYLTGMMYHLGTLAFGSLSIALLRVWRMLLSWFVSSSATAGNAVAATSGACCSCFADFFDRILQKLNKFAFMDVAVNSNNFCTAAGHALGILTYNAPAAMTLHGCTRIFEVVGVTSITAVGVSTCYVLATQVPTYGNPESEKFVEDPIFLCFIAGIVSFFIAMPFMLCFATAADTILFCFALDKSRMPAEHEDERMGFFARCFSNSSARQAEMKYDDSHHSPKTRSLIQRMNR